VLVFIPQILLMFLLISLLEGVGYMSRAAFLMDRLMAKAGLEGRAFVALLSSLACAVPGIMSTRTLPSAKDRIATMMAAPLMTCSARLPVYILLTGLLVAPGTRVGPFGAQGVVMFGMYLLGAVTAMTAAWVFKRLGSRHGPVMPFYMEMPPYRIPTLRSVLLSMWESSRMFLRKCGTIILTTTALLWILLNLPQPNGAQLAAAHVDTGNPAAVSAYVIDHSVAARIGRAAEPVFEPLGFDWRVNVGVIASLSARESFVSTLGQVAAAQDPENPHDALTSMTYADGPRRGEHVFTPATIAALLIFFAYALQCMSTVSALRRETGGWRWPLTAFGYLFVLAWSMSFLAHTLVTAIQSGAG
jgi:ferrous iron transport protein B